MRSGKEVRRMFGRRKREGKYEFIPEEPEAEEAAELPEFPEAETEELSEEESYAFAQDYEDLPETEEYYGDDPEEDPAFDRADRPEKRSIFRPETRKPNFLLSVASTWCGCWRCWFS